MAEQTDFGKGALIAGIVLGVAAGAFGVYNMSASKVDRPQTRLNVSQSEAEASLTAVADEAMALRKKNSVIKDVAPEGATINGKPRYAPVFFSPELWQVNDDARKDTIVIDIYDPSSPNVHADVPNHWFTSNGLRDVMSRRDALTVDSDEDGFTNREEFDAKTNPSDAKSLPPLVQVGKTPKLVVVGDAVTSGGVISVDSGLAYSSNPTEADVRIYATPGSSKVVARFSKRAPGMTFGLLEDKSDEKRFEVIGFEKETFGSSTESVLKVRDNGIPGRAKEFTVRAGSPARSASDYEKEGVKGYLVKDVKVKLRVTAGPAAGTKDGEFEVLEGATFEIPGSNGIVCELKSVDASGSVNIKPKGAESEMNVPKVAE